MKHHLTVVYIKCLEIYEISGHLEFELWIPKLETAPLK